MVDLDSLSPEELITRYVIECKNQGHFLPYTDHAIISNWIKHVQGDTDRLLLVLSEVLPSYFEKKKGRPGQLNGVNRLVLSKVKSN